MNTEIEIECEICKKILDLSNPDCLYNYDDDTGFYTCDNCHEDRDAEWCDCCKENPKLTTEPLCGDAFRDWCSECDASLYSTRYKRMYQVRTLNGDFCSDKNGKWDFNDLDDARDLFNREIDKGEEDHLELTETPKLTDDEWNEHFEEIYPTPVILDEWTKLPAYTYDDNGAKVKWNKETEGWEDLCEDCDKMWEKGGGYRNKKWYCVDCIINQDSEDEDDEECHYCNTIKENPNGDYDPAPINGLCYWCAEDKKEKEDEQHKAEFPEHERCDDCDCCVKCERCECDDRIYK